MNLACKSLGMSYKKAWKMVNQMNESGTEQVVIRKTGGSGGGGSIVSEYGLNLIKSFEEMRMKIWDILEEENKRFASSHE
ncbi:MAG: molybdate transport system regulatory protein [Flavobacteriales bacterium]|jgi:molybdate transport system regulatory protein